MLLFRINMSRGTFQKKIKQKKLLPILSDPHVNKIGTKTCQGL